MPVNEHTNAERASEALASASASTDAAIRAVLGNDPITARRAIAEARALLAVADNRLVPYAPPPA